MHVFNFFRADRTSCTMCYATDPTNNLGLGIDTGTAGQAIVGILGRVGVLGQGEGSG